MPIKGKSEERRFPRVGKLKIGIKGKNKEGKEIPQSIDYFKADGKYAKVFHKIYGEKPSEIDIVFPLNNLDDILDHHYRWYVSSGLKCIGDGENANRVNDKGEMEDRECPCEMLEKEDCKETLRLTFLIPKVPVIGVWQLVTRSINTRLNAFSELDLVNAMAGKVAGIPMSMSVQYEYGNLAGSKSRFPVITITPKTTMEKLIQIGAIDMKPGDIFRELSKQETLELPEPESPAKEENSEELAIEEPSESEPEPPAEEKPPKKAEPTPAKKEDYPTHTDFEFMENMKIAKSILGDNEYYEILNNYNIPHSNHKKALDEKEKIEADIKHLISSMLFSKLMASNLTEKQIEESKRQIKGFRKLRTLEQFYIRFEKWCGK